MKRIVIKCENSDENRKKTIELMNNFFCLFKYANGNFSCENEKIRIDFSFNNQEKDFGVFLEQIEKMDFQIKEVSEDVYKAVSNHYDDGVGIREFDEIANSSECFDEFLEKVCKELGLQKKTELYIRMIKTNCEFEQVSYSLMSKEIGCSSSYLQSCANFAVQRLRLVFPEYKFVLPSQLISILKKYQNKTFDIISKPSKDSSNILVLEEL